MDLCEAGAETGGQLLPADLTVGENSWRIHIRHTPQSSPQEELCLVAPSTL